MDQYLRVIDVKPKTYFHAIETLLHQVYRLEEHGHAWFKDLNQTPLKKGTSERQCEQVSVQSISREQEELVRGRIDHAITERVCNGIRHGADPGNVRLLSRL